MPFKGISQIHNLRIYGVNDGLPGNQVYTMIQDKTGMIWIAGEAGICRFDGRTFYRPPANYLLNDEECLYLFCDSQGRIWLSGLKEHLLLIPDPDQWTDDKFSVKKVLPLINFFSGVLETKTGEILVSSDKYIWKINKKLTIDTLRNNLDLKSFFVRMFLFHSQSGEILALNINNQLLGVENNNVILIDTLNIISYPPLLPEIPNRHALFFLGKGGIYKLENRKPEKIIPDEYLPACEKITTFYQDKNNRTWVLSEKGEIWITENLGKGKPV